MFAFVRGAGVLQPRRYKPWLVYEFKKLDEYRAIKPDAENAKMLHQKYPLPASLDELLKVRGI